MNRRARLVVVVVALLLLLDRSIDDLHILCIPPALYNMILNDVICTIPNNVSYKNDPTRVAVLPAISGCSRETLLNPGIMTVRAQDD
jgi:hypothetical protein